MPIKLHFLVIISIIIFSTLFHFLRKPAWRYIERKKKWKSFSCVQLFMTPWTIVHGILQARILEWVTFPSPGDLPNPGIKPRSPILQADSLPAEPQGKPKNTGVGSLSLLQGIFLTQESNCNPHCRQILYQLSYEGKWVWLVCVWMCEGNLCLWVCVGVSASVWICMRMCDCECVNEGEHVCE